MNKNVMRKKTGKKKTKQIGETFFFQMKMLIKQQNKNRQTAKHNDDMATMFLIWEIKKMGVEGF